MQLICFPSADPLRDLVLPLHLRPTHIRLLIPPDRRAVGARLRQCLADRDFDVQWAEWPAFGECDDHAGQVMNQLAGPLEAGNERNPVVEPGEGKAAGKAGCVNMDKATAILRTTGRRTSRPPRDEKRRRRPRACHGKCTDVPGRETRAGGLEPQALPGFLLCVDEVCFDAEAFVQETHQGHAHLVIAGESGDLGTQRQARGPCAPAVETVSAIDGSLARRFFVGREGQRHAAHGDQPVLFIEELDFVVENNGCRLCPVSVGPSQGLAHGAESVLPPAYGSSAR